MEQVNQELEQYLQLFISQRQDDWAGLLPLAEFQYNNHIHSSTQHSPFFLNTGHKPCMGFEPNLLTVPLGVHQQVQRQMKDTLEEAKAALAKSKDDMTKYYNQKQTLALDYKPSDMVYLDSSDIQTTIPSHKLSH